MIISVHDLPSSFSWFSGHYIASMSAPSYFPGVALQSRLDPLSTCSPRRHEPSHSRFSWPSHYFLAFVETL